tara:strand:+ start:214 stop:579 length:366 start_codon:yes stop_codon:yes gene_type:complete
MGTSSSAAWTATKQLVTTTAQVWLSFVGPDSLYTPEEWPESSDYDRCYGNMYIGGKFFSQVGFHYPVGKLQANTEQPYTLGKECWIKRANGNSLELVVGEVDPVANVSRQRNSDEVLDLPE